MSQFGLSTRRSCHIPQQITVTIAVVVNKQSHDVAAIIDPIRVRQNGSRYIDRSERASSE